MLNLEVISPEKILFSGEIKSVKIPGVQGEFEILKDHAAIVSLLTEGEVIIKGEELNTKTDLKELKENDSEIRFPIKDGTIEVFQNRVVLLVE